MSAPIYTAMPKPAPARHRTHWRLIYLHLQIGAPSRCHSWHLVPELYSSREAAHRGQIDAARRMVANHGLPRKVGVYGGQFINVECQPLQCPIELAQAAKLLPR